MEEARRLFAERARRCRRSSSPGARSGTRAWSGSPPAGSPRSSRRPTLLLAVEEERRHRLGPQRPRHRAARVPRRLEGPDGALRRPRAGGGADRRGCDASRGAAAGVGGGRRRVAGRAPGRAGTSTSCTWRRGAPPARCSPSSPGSSPTARATPGRWCAPARCALDGAPPALRQRPPLGPRAAARTAPSVDLVGWGWQERARRSRRAASRSLGLDRARRPDRRRPVLRLLDCRPA